MKFGHFSKGCLTTRGLGDLLPRVVNYLLNGDDPQALQKSPDPGFTRLQRSTSTARELLANCTKEFSPEN